MSIEALIERGRGLLAVDPTRKSGFWQSAWAGAAAARALDRYYRKLEAEKNEARRLKRMR